MTSSFHKVLQLCERQCFIWPVLHNRNSTNFIEYFKFGFAGELLKNNIFQEWLLSMVVNTEENIFPYHSRDLTTTNIAKGNVLLHSFFCNALAFKMGPFGSYLVLHGV
jgi:glycyl-tRNA synthetase (class II)